MRYWLWPILLALSTNTHAAAPSAGPSVEALAWMAGTWRGTVGAQTVEEAWSQPRAGTMGTMVLLSDADGVSMIELIVIREHDDTLMLHVRQFSPALELRLEQDMRLSELAERTVRFVAGDGASIKQLAYALGADDVLNVELTLGDGTRVTAALRRTQGFATPPGAPEVQLESDAGASAGASAGAIAGAGADQPLPGWTIAPLRVGGPLR